MEASLYEVIGALGVTDYMYLENIPGNSKIGHIQKIAFRAVTKFLVTCSLKLHTQSRCVIL